MVAHSKKGLGLVIVAGFAIAACGGSTLKGGKTQDSATNSPDLGLRSDLPAEGSPLYQDSSADSGVVTADTGPDRPWLGSDSASPDTTIVEDDGGRDGRIVQGDAAVDRAAQDGASDSLDDGSSFRVDGGDVETGLVASLIVTGLTYADAPEGETSPMRFTVSNVGGMSSGAFAIAITGPGANVFKIVSSSCDKPLPAGESCLVTLVFNAPNQGGIYHASLNIMADGFPGGAFVAQLTGETA